MTSTNDGNEVKINQTSGPKGKAHFIELFKSLDFRLTEAKLPSERTKYLCEAWRKIHDICLHSTASAHDHLLSWLQRHTARVVLQTAWQRPERKDDRASLEEAINFLIHEAQSTAASRNGPSPAWEAELAERGEWFKRILEQPWQHPVLTCLLNASETPPSDDEVLEWLKEERGVTFVVRLQTLAAEKQCDDIAMTLATTVMDRVRRDETPSDCHDTKGQSERTTPAFGDRLKEHAGFTTDVWELLVDIEYVLLHKRDSARCIDLAKQTPLRSAHNLIERLQSRQDTSPRDKRLWRSAKEVAMLIAQVVITRCMMIPQCKGDARSALYRCAHSLARLTPVARLPAAAAALAAPAPTAAHLHLLAAAIDAQLAQKNEVSMKPFLCELYVRAITAGMNELERLKLKTEKEKEARAMEQTLASWFVQLGAVLGTSTRFKCECALTAFSLHPSPQMYEQIKAAPHLPSINMEPAEEISSEATNPEFGSWASDSRSQTNFVKTSETLKMKARQNQANVLSTAILNECEGLGLSLELCQDITMLLSGPRVKTLSWDMDRELLLENCRGYLERTHGGTKALTTELKYLNIRPEDFQYLPEEDEDENNLYYGIEKGYEHLVETEPGEIWEDINDFVHNTETYSSDGFDYTTSKQRKKKTKKHVSHSDEDPLSQVAEAKRKEKKERPHSKERSKESKRDKSEKKPPVDPLELNADGQKKEKPKRERKKKEQAPKPDGSLSNLVGLKVAKPRKKKNALNIDVDSQGQSSIQSVYSDEKIIYDGQFSMDDIRSPRNTHGADGVGLMQNEFSKANGKVRISRPHQHQTLHNMPHRTPSVSSQRTASPSEHSRNNSPAHVSDDVRNSISRLMEFRRLKALENDRKKPNAIMRPKGLPIDNNVSPKSVSIPEIPKSYINKQQSDKLKELKKEVDNILKQRHNSSAIPSPVIQYASKNTISSPPCQSYYASPTKFNINADTPPSRSYTPAPEHRDRPDRFSDSVNYVSIYDKDEPSYSQNPFPVSSPNKLRRPSNASTADVNYQDYLHEFHKQSTYNHYAEKAAPAKKVIRPISRVTPVVPYTNSEQKTSQSAKQIPQKPEGSLNTFSRMNYYKNKQTDTKKSQDLTQQTTIANKLDGFILDHLFNSKQDQSRSILKSAQASNNSYVMPRTHTSTKPRDHPAISKMLQNNTPAHNNKTTTTAPTIHQSDQRDFLQFLQQQNVVPGPSTSSLPPSNRQWSSQSNVNKPSNSQNGIQATNYQMIKPNETKKPKEINIISSSIIKTADPNNVVTSHPVTKRPPGQGKPRKQETRLHKPTKPETAVRKNPEEWENVMNAILKQKTPYRGPNALEVALNKSSFERAFEESLKRPTSLFKSNASSADDRISRIEYNHKELVKITKTKTVSSTTSEEIISITERKTHAVLTTEVTRPSQTKNNSKTKKMSNNCGKTSSNQIEKCLKKHNIHSDTLEKLMRQNSIQIHKTNSFVAENELRGKVNKAQSNIIKPNNHVQAKMSMTQARFDVKQDAKQINVIAKHNINDVQIRLLKDTQPKQDQLTSGMPSSDYDLLEELIDDDLRKEIGELSSDEESYNAAAQDYLNDAITVNKPVNVVYNRPSNNLVAETSPQDCAQPPIRKENMQKQMYAQNTVQQWPYKKEPTGLKIIRAAEPITSSMSFSTASAQNVTTHIVTHPVQVSTYNANMTQITVQPNFYTATAPQPVPVQNVMLFSPTLVYEKYAPVQAPIQAVANATHTAVTVAPNSNLYQTNQFLTPVGSPHLISSAATHVLNTRSSVTTVLSNPSPVTVVNAPEYLNTSSEIHQPMYEATAKENVIMKRNLWQPTYVVSAQDNIVTESKKLESVLAVSSAVQIPKCIENKPEIRTLSDTNLNKSCERKVLIEVQEKQTDEKIDCKRRAQKSIEKDLKTEADNERLIKKRMAIINRKISHVCGMKTIALGYSPLRIPSPTRLHSIDNKDATDEDHPAAINNMQEPNKDIRSPATPDSFKENKIETVQVRRILLRSSNKLKNKNSPSTSSKLPSDKKVKVAPVSFDTLKNTAVQNDQSDIGTNNKQKRVSKRIRNISVIPKDNSILEAKVIRKVPSKKAIATKKRQDDSDNIINVPPLNHDADFLDIEAEISVSTIPKAFTKNLINNEDSDDSFIGTKENEANQMFDKEGTPFPVVLEKKQLLDKDLSEPNTRPVNTKAVDIPATTISSVTAMELAAKGIDVAEKTNVSLAVVRPVVKVANIPTATEASINDVIPTETTVKNYKIDAKLAQDNIPMKEESESDSIVLTNNELMPVEIINQVENTNYLTKQIIGRSTFIDNKTIKNAPEKAGSLQDDKNIVPSAIADDDDVEIIEDPKYVPPPTSSQNCLPNSPQMSFSEDDIKIEEIIDPNNSDPLQKKIRIKLANGKTFKGTIRGCMSFEYLQNPEIKSMLISKFQKPKKLYSLKLNINRDQSNGTKLISCDRYQESKPVETVNLLSDDENEVCSQEFTTEFGKFKVNTIDSNDFTKHQDKFKLKCYVLEQKLSEEAISTSKRELALTDCVIPRKDTPRESDCAIVSKDTTQDNVFINADTPQACAILNEDTPQQRVILNKHSVQKCASLNEYTPQECVILREDTTQECIIPTKEPVQECVISKKETEECVLINESNLKDPQIPSTVPSKGVEGITKDFNFSDVLAPLNAREKPEEAIIIDDESSNDSDDLAMVKIDVLKNMLLKELGVVDIMSPTSKSSEDVQVTWASEAIDLTDDVTMELSDSTSDEESSNKYQKIMKKCFVKLVRCDQVMNQPATAKPKEVTKPLPTPANEDDEPEDTVLKAAPITRSGSISILEDFALDDNSLEFKRTSPVMEVYDMIVSLKAQNPEHIQAQPVVSIECESEWLVTKKMNKVQSMYDLTTDCDLFKCESEWLRTKKMCKVQSLNDLTKDCYLSKCESEWLTTKKMNKVQSVNDLTTDNYLSQCESEWLATKKINKVQSVNDLTTDSYLSQCESEWMATKKFNKVQSVNDLTTDSYLSQCESEWLATKTIYKVQSMYDLTTECNLSDCESEWMTTKKMSKLQSTSDLTTDCNWFICESEWLITKKMNKVRSMCDLTTDCYLSQCESEWMTTKKSNKLQTMYNLKSDCYLSQCESEWMTTKKINKLQTMYNLKSDCYLSQCESEWMITKKGNKHQSINDLTDFHVSKSFVVPKLAAIILKFIQQGNYVNKYYGEIRRLPHVSLKRKLKPSTLQTTKISKFNDSPNISVSNGSSVSLLIVRQANNFPELAKPAVNDQVIDAAQNICEDKDNLLRIDRTIDLTDADVKISSVSVSFEDDDSILTENETIFDKRHEYCTIHNATLDLTDNDVANMSVSITFDDDDDDPTLNENDPKIEKRQVEENCTNQDDHTLDLTDTDVKNLSVSVSYDDEDSILNENEPKIEKHQVVDHEESCIYQNALSQGDTEQDDSNKHNTVELSKTNSDEFYEAFNKRFGEPGDGIRRSLLDKSLQSNKTLQHVNQPPQTTAEIYDVLNKMFGESERPDSTDVSVCNTYLYAKGRVSTIDNANDNSCDEINVTLREGLSQTDDSSNEVLVEGVVDMIHGDFIDVSNEFDLQSEHNFKEIERRRFDEDSDSDRKESSFKEILKKMHGEDELECLKVRIPKRTYSCPKYHTEILTRSKGLKRKKEMTEVKTSEKKYRKGKNIDYPKISTQTKADLAYAKEYKRIIDYCSTIKFSYALPFHIDCIDVESQHEDWPILAIHSDEIEDSVNAKNLLYSDTEDIESAVAVTDPLKLTLNDEIVNGGNVHNYNSIDINEINFSKGFGEKSGRVIQKIESGNTKLSAATLSDVKQYQPFPKITYINLNQNQEIETQKVNLQFLDLIRIKQKVKSIFKKTTVELTTEMFQEKKYGTNEELSHLSIFPFDLTSTEFMEMPYTHSIVNVVQVGQMTINATAQNPVTCDPRVTHVSDASPSQCSENSNGEGLQSNMETEYTELTTANIGLPLLQEYSQHRQLTYEGQHSEEDGNGTMSIVKIELIEEDTSPEKQENDLYEHDFSPLPNTNVEYSFEETSNTLFHSNPNAENTDNPPSNLFNTSSNNMDATFTHVFTCSTNIDGSYTNLENSSSIDSSYASMENASTAVYSTLSNVGSSSNDMENASNLSDTSSNKINDTANLETRNIENLNPNMYSMGTETKDLSNGDNLSNIASSNMDDSHMHINETTPKYDDRDMENTAYDYTYENIEDFAENMENNNNGNNYSANEENYSSNGIHENFSTNDNGFDSNTENYPSGAENYSPHVENYPTNIDSYHNVESYVKNNSPMEEGNLTSMLEDSQPQDLSMANSTQDSKTFKDKGHENGITKTDQIAHAMTAAGILSESVITSSPEELVSLISQGTQSYAKQTQSNQQINVMTLQQALAQVLPPPLNQSSPPENQVPNNPVPPQVLHIVQGNNGQTVINKPNGTHLVHIVQNKSNPTNGLSLVDAGLQQGGNQLIHIVNNGNQNNAQFLKRVNLLTNLQNAQGSNEQKMIQLVCKSADGKSIQLNTGPQRSMVLRLHPSSIQTAQKPPDSQDLSASLGDANTASNLDSSQEIKSRSMYEENYAQFIQSSASSPGPSASPCQEKSTSLPKFNQVFGKLSYQDNAEILNHNGLQETPESPSDENNIHVEQPNEPNNPPSLASDNPPESTQAQSHTVQQIKQAISPMNVQTMHGGVIYTRQIPVNIGGGQTINLITVPSTEMVDDSFQKQQPDGPFVNHEEPSSIIKLVPHNSQSNQNVTGESSAQAGPSNELHNTPPAQAQPVLTQMRIKLPMLSKRPQIVPGTRLVRPFFQIQRNVIAGANQPVYQQLVLTTAPSLGQTIRLPAQTPPVQSPQAQPILVQAAPHSQPSPHIPVQQVQHAPTSHHTHSGQQGHSAPSTPQPTSVRSNIKEEPASELNNLTLEQLREFDMVLEQVKERSVHPPQPRTRKKHPRPAPADSTDGPALVATASESPQPQQVLFSADNNQTANIVSFVNRKSTITASTSFARSPDSSGIMDTPSSSTHVHVTATVSAKVSSDGGTTVVARPKKKKKKKSSSMSLSQNNPLKPQEDEQTTQRILYILAEYKEQVENSPHKNKPAPRRRNLFPPTPGSKRKRSHCSSRSACRREGAEMSPTHEHGENGEDSLITLGSEDSSCGTTFSECTDCQESHSPEDSEAKVVRRLTFEHETTTQTITQTRTTLPQQNAGEETQTITVARTTTAASTTQPKPTTTVLMPANYLLPVSMIKGGQQIAIMTNRGPKILVGTGDNNTGAFLFQRLIGPGLKPVLTRPGVRHIKLPPAALHNLQTFNIQTTPVTQVQPPDSTAPPPTPGPPDLVETRAMSSPWPDPEASDKPERGLSPDCTEPWNMPSSGIAEDYGYEEIVRTDNMERTVLDAIPDRYSPDMEAQRIFDKMFDVDSKKSMYSPRCGYDIDTSDGDDKPYPQVVQRKDGRHHRVTHVSTSALRHKYAILEHEIMLQKSLSEECEDLGVDSPSTSDLFPEADILFGAPSPAHEQTIEQCVSPPPIPMPQLIPHPDIDDEIATDRLLTTEQRADELDLIDDVGEIVTVGEDGTATIPTINAEEFAKSHPNTTFHTEPEDGEITIAQPPFTIAHGLKRHITFHANRVPGTVVIAPQTSVISQATINSNNGNNTVKFTNIDNIINTMTGPQNVTISSVVVKDGHQNIQNQPSRPVKKTDNLKDPGTSTRQVPKFDAKEPAPKPLSKFDSLLHESKLRLNQSYQGRQVIGTQVIRRVDSQLQRRFSERDRPNHRSNSRFFFEEPPKPTPNLKHIAEEMRLRNDRAIVESMGDNASSPGPELFWDGPQKRYPVNDSEKVVKSPFDELLNDSSAYGPHTRLDSVIKAARPDRTYERTTFEGIGVGSEESRPLRTYPAKRPHTQQTQDTERHFPLKSTITIDHQEDLKVTHHNHDVSKKPARGVAKRNCNCCNNGPTAAPPKKRSRAKKPKPQQQCAPTPAPNT